MTTESSPGAPRECPFCGARDASQFAVGRGPLRAWACDICGARGPLVLRDDSDAPLIAAWNRRAAAHDERSAKASVPESPDGSPLPLVPNAELERLRAIETAARNVRDAVEWGLIKINHPIMRALCEALRGGSAPSPAARPSPGEKTVRARVLVGVNARGGWETWGWGRAAGVDLKSVEVERREHERYSWIEADVPLPVSQPEETIQARVVEESRSDE